MCLRRHAKGVGSNASHNWPSMVQCPSSNDQYAIQIGFSLITGSLGALFHVSLSLFGRAALAIDKWEWHEKSFNIFTCFISRTRRYMAGHELNPNRDVKRRQHTACASVCYQEDSQSPNLRSSSAMYLPHWQHRRSRSAPSDQISSPVAHPASRSMTSPGDGDDQTCC